jgi:hypothetical protein
MRWFVYDTKNTGTVLKVCNTLAGAKRSVARRYNKASGHDLLEDGEGFGYSREDVYRLENPGCKL